jgi:rhodanese-related sulfurtransferase
MKNESVQVRNSVSPAELAACCRAGVPVEIIDVRTMPEHAAAHAVGARCVPLDRLDPAAILKNRTRPDAPLYLICQSGARASKAAELFRRAGFDGCVLVEGGTQAWMDAGLPVVRGRSGVIPLMRQVQIVAGAVSAAGAGLALAVDGRFALVPLLVGGGLLFAGVTGACGLALVLAKMPWNRSGHCPAGAASN